jgi:hypothetical protein
MMLSLVRHGHLLCALAQMYAVHPYRMFNVARSLVSGVDLAPARSGFLADPRAYLDNTDWNQGIMDGMCVKAGERGCTLQIATIESPQCSHLFSCSRALRPQGRCCTPSS